MVPVLSLFSNRKISNLRNRTGEERRRQTLCYKRDNNYVWKDFPQKFSFLKAVNIDVKWRWRQNTQVIALSLLSDTNVLLFSSFSHYSPITGKPAGHRPGKPAMRWKNPWEISLDVLTLSLPECLMEFCKVTLTFEYADEILRCDHSNESSLPVLSHDAICFSKF